jgi:hypothetical protein
MLYRQTTHKPLAFFADFSKKVRFFTIFPGNYAFLDLQEVAQGGRFRAGTGLNLTKFAS